MVPYSSDLEQVWTTTPAPARKISSSAPSVERQRFRERDLRRKIRDGHSNVTYTLLSTTMQRGTRGWSSCNSNHHTCRYSYWIVNIWYTRVNREGEDVLIDWLMAACPIRLAHKLWLKVLFVDLLWEKNSVNSWLIWLSEQDEPGEFIYKQYVVCMRMQSWLAYCRVVSFLLPCENVACTAHVGMCFEKRKIPLIQVGKRCSLYSKISISSYMSLASGFI
jgi:hypothetical protein